VFYRTPLEALLKEKKRREKVMNIMFAAPENAWGGFLGLLLFSCCWPSFRVVSKPFI
jgi:hypothetical protein